MKEVTEKRIVQNRKSKEKNEGSGAENRKRDTGRNVEDKKKEGRKKQNMKKGKKK